MIVEKTEEKVENDINIEFGTDTSQRGYQPLIPSTNTCEFYLDF